MALLVHRQQPDVSSGRFDLIVEPFGARRLIPQFSRFLEYFLVAESHMREKCAESGQIEKSGFRSGKSRYRLLPGLSAQQCS